MISFLLFFLPLLLATAALCPCEEARDASTSPALTPPDFKLDNRSSSEARNAVVMCILLVGNYSSFELENLNKQINSMIHVNNQHRTGFQLLYIKPESELANATSFEKSCNSLARITRDPSSSLYERQVCPGICRPIPEVVIPSDIVLHNSPHMKLFDWLDKELPITCSLTVGMISKKRHRTDAAKWGKKRDILFLMREIFWRRLLECNEVMKSQQQRKFHRSHQHHRHSNSNTKQADVDHIPRRAVKAIVIWIGTTSNMNLVKDQALVLTGVPVHGEDAVVGWAATEDLYQCNENSTLCTDPRANKKYKFMPSSSMNYNGDSLITFLIIPSQTPYIPDYSIPNTRILHFSVSYHLFYVFNLRPQIYLFTH